MYLKRLRIIRGIRVKIVDLSASAKCLSSGEKQAISLRNSRPVGEIAILPAE